MRQIHKQVLVTEKTYDDLRNRGQFGDSFNDVIVKLLEETETGGVKN